MSIQEPLRFEPQAQQRVWGGDRLAQVVRGEFECSEQVGEVWQLFDRSGQSSIVSEGSLAGRSLGGLMLSEGEALLGTSRPAPDGSFPVLIKYLDTVAPLSVQVHPDQAVAERLGSEAKEECWYVLKAEPNSVVHLGLKPEVDAARFASECEGSGVVDLLQTFEPHVGDFIHVPPGTLHAVGAGLTLVEVQQNADTTYRVYDWDRAGLDGGPRELHREEALRSIHFDLRPEGPCHPVLDELDPVNRRAGLLDGELFGVELLQLHDNLDHDTSGRAWIYVVLSGSGLFQVGGEDEWRMGAGETWLVPADVGAYRIAGCDGELEVLRVEARA